jgi:hypothetical protein
MPTMSTWRSIARAVIPEAVRRPVRERCHAHAFEHAMRDFLADPDAALDGDGRLLRRLVHAWGNETFSALPEYLVACLQAASESNGSILECGSGLSTLLIGAVAQRRGRTLWTLEHHEGWGRRVRNALEHHGIDAVELCIAPLRDHGDFTWYDPPRERMPDDIDLVICDGPPGDTPGGRYGLVPVMRSHLAQPCTILLDDAWRDEERAIAARWADELGGRHTLEGDDKPYLRLCA